MELYIAEYLVENGFANDIVSALKIRILGSFGVPVAASKEDPV